MTVDVILTINDKPKKLKEILIEKKNLFLKVHSFSREFITNTQYNLISCSISGLKMLCLVMARILDKPDFFQVLFQSIGLMKKSGVWLFGLCVNLLTTLSLVF